MDNQKLENLLNLSLDASPAQRDRSSVLETGYSAADRTWELIVKYNGDIKKLESDVVKIETLINGYAIATVNEDFIDAFSQLDEIEYVEKPKRLFFQQK